MEITAPEVPVFSAPAPTFDKVSVAVRLVRSKDKPTRFEVTGDKAKVDALAAKIVAEVEKRLETPP